MNKFHHHCVIKKYFREDIKTAQKNGKIISRAQSDYNFVKLPVSSSKERKLSNIVSP